MIGQFSRTAMVFIEKTLRECEQCIGFSGAALSSPDGLVLAMHGQISGDEAAACASSLFVESETALSYIGESEPRMSYGLQINCWLCTCLKMAVFSL